MLMSAALCHAAGVGQRMVGSIFAFVAAAAELECVDAELLLQGELLVSLSLLHGC